MSLNTNQKKAVEYMGGPLLVIAGPGTGKTQLLSEKVAYIFKNTDTNPENILCLTFTETGASNMRERLKSIIGQDGAKVNIGTYHAFGTDILAQYKNYSENYDRSFDSNIDEVTQYMIIKTIQDSLHGTDILKSDNIKLIISTISSAKSKGLSADDLKLVAETNMSDAKVLSQSISPLLKNVVAANYQKSYDNAYGPIYELLKDYENTKPIVPTVERLIGTLARSLKQAIVNAESEESIKYLTKWRNDYFEKDSHGNYRLKGLVADKKLLSLANVMKKYDEYLQDNNLFDFDDMIQEAVSVLSNDKGFRDTLSERYQYIMLDEFQDTNPSQFAIIKQLTDYEKPMIMAVGDDDQAIYEFQGALSTNMTDFQNHYNSEVIPLVENYRSTQEILDFSHEVISQAPDRFADKELFAHKNNPSKSQIYRYEFRSSDMEYGFIAEEVAKLIKSGVPQNEIAVISYKRKYFLPLLPYLKSHPEINIAYEKQNNLLEDDKIHQLLTLCKYIYELANERNENTSIVEILGYPFFKLPMLEVIKIITSARKEHKDIFNCLASSDNPDIRSVAEFFANLVTRSFTEPLDVMIDYLIGASELNGYRSEFLDYYSKQSDYDAFTLYENLASLRGKLHKHFGDRSLKLSDLVNMISDYETAEMPINTTSPYKDADSAVQILTAHKAKGLEFEYVFIISADHMAWGKGKGNNTTLSLPKNMIHIRHTGITDGEQLRILYVALTRAKSGLYITNSLNDFNSKSPDRLEYFNEYIKDDKVISPFLPTNEVICKYDLIVDKTSENNLKNWVLSYRDASPDMMSIYQDRISNYRMSATSLATFVDIVYDGPVEFFKKEVLHFPSKPENESIAFGLLIHKVFEEITNHGISDDEAAKLFLDELEKHELDANTMNKLREKGPADLAVALSNFNSILRKGKAEVNLSSERITIDGVPVTGKIDHIIIDDKSKTIEIYDYKTASYKPSQWRANNTLFKYMLQLMFYKLLLNSSLTYSKYKVKKAHILFVVPDSKGEVHDKVYEYNDEDEKEIRALIKAVYGQISTLRFINDPEIFMESNHDLGIKDIEKFITLLLAKDK